MIQNKKLGTAALYVVLSLAVVAAGIFGRDKWYMIATSVLAIVYLLLMNDNHKAGYVLCIAYALSYGAISVIQKLYAGAAFHFLVLAPSAAFRLSRFGKEGETQVKSLSAKQWCAIPALCAGAAAGLFFLLRAIADAQPLLDACTLTIGAATSLLLSKNYREMWLFNTLGSLLYVAVWSVEFALRGTGLAIVALQIIVTFTSLRGWVLWTKRQKNNT